MIVDMVILLLSFTQLMKISSDYDLHVDEITTIVQLELLLPTRISFRHPLNSCDVVMM